MTMEWDDISPIALALLGGWIQYDAQSDARKRQMRFANEADAIAQQNAEKARAAIMANAQRYAPEARGKALSDEEGDLVRQFEQTARSASAAPVNTLGATSGAYTGSVAAEKARMGGRGKNLDWLFAKTLAPGRAAVKEGLGDAAAAEQASSLYGTGRAAMNAGSIDASRVQPNAAKTILGGVVSGIGGGLSKRRMPTIFGLPAQG